MDFSSSETNSANVCQLHLELEENLSFSFVQHEVEEEEEREKAENIRWYVVTLPVWNHWLPPTGSLARSK